MTNENQAAKRTLMGVVVGKKMQKTATVAIARLVQHPVYKKYLRRTTQIHVHDELDQAKLGDKVTITQCRPVSKLKSWKLVEVLKQDV